MGRMSRNKGRSGEREFLNLLGELIGDRLDRNLSQSDGGGADCISLPGFAIEVKRCEQLQLNTWWRQTIEQAQAADAVPILAYRQSRRPWSVVVPLSHLTNQPSDHTAQLTLEAFAELVGGAKP